MIHTPLISVIVAVYNLEKYVANCVESILQQTYKNIELILIDDGSTDGSAAICDYYKSIDERVSVYHKNNEGPGVARNYGLDRCSGEYVTFVDSDDWLEPHMYEILVKLALFHNTDITGCASIVDYEDGSSRKPYAGRQSGILDGKTCILDILYPTQYAWGAMYNKIYKRLLFDSVRFPPVYNLEDYAVSLRLFNVVDRIYFCEDPMYHYIIRQGSLSHTDWNERRIAILDTTNEIKKYFLSHGVSNDIIRGVNRFAFDMYSDVFYRVYKNKPTSRKKVVRERRKHAIQILYAYWGNAPKKHGDIKKIIKLLLALYVP